MKKKIFLGMELPKNKKVNKMARMMLSLLTISVIGMWIAYQKYNTISPPMFIDSSPKYGVIFNANQTLCLSDENERLVRTAHYEKLGLKDVSDVKFFDEGLLLVQADGAIKRCELQLDWCEQIGTLPSIDTDIVQRIIPSYDQQTFYIVQTNNSRIDRFSRTGDHLYRLPLSTLDLKYPGGGMALPDDLLLLSDPKHKKVILLHNKNANTAKILYTLSTKSSIEGSSYTKAFSAKIDTQYRLWINLANKAYTASDTLIADLPSLHAFMKDKTSLPTNEKLTDDISTILTDETLEYPVSLAPHLQGMLIADEKSFTIRYAEDKDITRPFGDTSIQKLLKKVSDDRSLYWYIFLLFGGIGILGMILGFIGAATEANELVNTGVDTRHTPHPLPKEKTIQADNRGVIWLQTNAKFRKDIRFLRWLLLVSSIGLVLISFFMLNDLVDDTTKTDLWKILGMEGIFVLISFALFLFRTEAQSIGTDGKYIFIKTAFGKYTYAPIEEVIHIERSRIIVNKKSLVFHMKGQEIFDKEQLDHYIMPLLERSKKINEFEFLSWQIKYDLWSFIWLPIIMIIFGILLYYT